MEREECWVAPPYLSAEGKQNKSSVTDDDLPYAIQALSASFNGAMPRRYENSAEVNSNSTYSRINSDNIGTSQDGQPPEIQNLSSLVTESSTSDDYLPSAIQALSMSLLESQLRQHRTIASESEDSTSSTSFENEALLRKSQSSIVELVLSSSRDLESSDLQEEQVLKRALGGSTEIVFGDDSGADNKTEVELPEVVADMSAESKTDDLTFGIRALSMSLSAEETLPVPPLYKTIVFEPGPIGLQLEPVREDPKYACRVIRFVDGGPKNPGQARRSGKIMPGDAIIRAEANGIVGCSYEEIMQLLTDTWATRTLIFQSMWDSSILDAPTTLRSIEAPSSLHISVQRHMTFTKQKGEESSIENEMKPLSLHPQDYEERSSLNHDALSHEKGESTVENQLNLRSKDTSGWRFWGLPESKQRSAHAAGLTIEDASSIEQVQKVSKAEESKVDPLPPLGQIEQPSGDNPEDLPTLRHSGRQGWQVWALGTTQTSSILEQALPLERSTAHPTVVVDALQKDTKDVRKSMDERGWQFWSRLDHCETQQSTLIKLPIHTKTTYATIQGRHHLQSQAIAEPSLLPCDEKEMPICFYTTSKSKKEAKKKIIGGGKSDSDRKSEFESNPQLVQDITSGQLRHTTEKGNFEGKVDLSSVQVDLKISREKLHSSLMDSAAPLLSFALYLDDRETQLSHRQSDRNSRSLIKLDVSQEVKASESDGQINLSSIRPASKAMSCLLPHAVGDKSLLCKLSYDHLKVLLNGAFASHPQTDTGLRNDRETKAAAVFRESIDVGSQIELKTRKPCENRQHLSGRSKVEADAAITSSQVRRHCEQAEVEHSDFDGVVHLSSVLPETIPRKQDLFGVASNILPSCKASSTFDRNFDERERQYSSNDDGAILISEWHLGQHIKESEFDGNVCLSSVHVSKPLHQHSHFLLPSQAVIEDNHLLCQLSYDEREAQLDMTVGFQKQFKASLPGSEIVSQGSGTESISGEDEENSQLERDKMVRLEDGEEENAMDEKSIQITGNETRLEPADEAQEVTIEPITAQQSYLANPEKESPMRILEVAEERRKECPADTPGQEDKKETRLEKNILFSPGPLGLQLEPVIGHPKFACRVVRFVDGGPHNPGQARSSCMIKPGDYLISAEANGIVGVGSYDKIMRVLKHASVPRTLVIQAAWEESHLDTTLVPSAVATTRNRSLVTDLAHAPSTQRMPDSIQVTALSNAPWLDRMSPIHSEDDKYSPNNEPKQINVPAEVITFVKGPKLPKKNLPSFEKLQKKYISIEKLRPPKPQKHIERKKETEKKVALSLPQDWVNKGAPLKKSSLSKEQELAREKRYEEEASRLMVASAARRRAIQAELARNTWNFENVVLGAVALTATSTVGVVSMAATVFSSAVSVCLKIKRYVEDEDESHRKKEE